jgi:sulfur relay (sulfurtransferase) DsrF/TusC family protein
MEHIAMILRKPPYGDINAAEAVRHALGGVSGDFKVSLIMTDGGVLLAKKGQDDTGTGFTNLEAALKDCIDMDVEVIAEQVSLMQNNIGQEDIVKGVKVADIDEITELLKKADTTMIF